MAQQTGAGAKLVLGYETAFKTISTSGFVLPINSSGIKSSRNLNSAATLRGNANPVEPFDGNISVAGSVVVPVDSIAFWYWLKAAFGTPTTTGAGPYVHTFKAGTARPFVTIEHQFTELSTAKYFQYTGCKVGGMSFSAGDDGELVATFDIVGAVETIASASFHGAAVAQSLGRLKNSHLALTEGGSTLANGKMVDAKIGFGLDTGQYVIGGGGVLGSLPDGIMDVSGNLNLLFENTTMIEKANASTESALILTFTDSATSALEITFPEIKYSRNSPGIEGPQGIAVALPWGGYYDNNADTTSVKVVLTNSVAHAGGI